MSSSADFMDFDFAGSVKQATQGLVLRPLVESYLYDAKFPAFDLHFREQEMERKPDGFFHPSTHPDWEPWALYRYLAYPDTFPVEKKRFMSTLAVTFGKIWHEFIQMVLTDMGLMPSEWQRCEMCPPDLGCHEAGFLDEGLGERGHCDGLLDLSRIGRAVPDHLVRPVFEFKTRNDNFSNLTKVEDNDLEYFKAKWPEYYGQQQRYQRAFGRRGSIVLMLDPGWPFTMREFQIPYDAAYNAKVDLKYRAVRQAVADQAEPFCCRSKGCPSAGLCRV